MPVNMRSPLIDISPTDRWSGNVLPSRRRPVTWRPAPMIFATPVSRYCDKIAVVLVVIGDGISIVTLRPNDFGLG